MKLILIDIDNTLLDFDLSAAAAMKTAFEQCGLSYAPPMFKIFSDINNRLWRQVETGTLTKDGLYDIRWQLILQELGMEANCQQLEKCFLKALAETAVPMAGAKDLVEYLSTKYVVIAASNSVQERQLYRLKNSGLLPYLDDVYTSERVGCEKPNPQFFAGCLCNYAEIEKAEICFIGDSLTADMAGGIAYGMKTCWFNPKGKPLPEDMAVDYQVRTLAAIKNIL